MSRDNFFKNELAFLKEEGRAFSKLYPQLNHFFNGRRSDPEVERLLESFAFLSGHLREKIEDDFPEMTHSIINRTCPNYLRSLPSTSIVKFAPKPFTISQQQVLHKGMLLESKLVDGVSCRFRTCRDVDIYPIELNHISAMHSRDTSEINADFKIIGTMEKSQFCISKLRFFLGEDRYTAQTLYLWLAHYLHYVELTIGENKVRLSTRHVKPVGFSPQDAILPHTKEAYDGYRIIQEYFAFEHGFLFFDLLELEQIALDPLLDCFSINFVFHRGLPADFRVSPDNFQLFCTPVINLFEHGAEPIQVNAKHKQEYDIRPSGGKPHAYEIFSVDNVEGWKNDDYQDKRYGKPKKYHSFEGVYHMVERVAARNSVYYRVKRQATFHQQGFRHLLSFVRSDESICEDLSETIFIRLTCTNLKLPMQLKKGDIHVTTDTVPSYVTFSNITDLTPPLESLFASPVLWHLVSNFSLNYLSLLSRDALCSILRVYDFRALENHQAEQITTRRLKGIISIESTPIEKVLHGVARRGIRSTLMLSQAGFENEGDLYLFGAVLSRFFPLYVSENSFHELLVINVDNNERYTWGNQWGVLPLI